MDLDEALREFDRVETNLARLQAVWTQLEDLVPSGVAFPGASPEDMRYEELRRAFADLADGLPPIDGQGLEAEPLSLGDIAQSRFDANEVGEIEMAVRVETAIEAPTHAIADYRHRFTKARKRLVRQRSVELLEEIDSILATLPQNYASDGTDVSDNPAWETLAVAIREMRRLLAQDLPANTAWGTLFRHLSFAQGVDLHDIASTDWPAVRPDVEQALYGELEPLPVKVADLGAVASEQPQGPVTTELQWDVLDDDKFERLVFNLFASADGYENPQWLMKTRAPDRGRDLSAWRVVHDSLAETSRLRAIVQCRHWRSQSMGPTDCADAVAVISGWEPPPVDVLIIVTSGRFTADGVRWVEQHNEKRGRPLVEMWPESRLELLLASRAALVTEFGLRG